MKMYADEREWGGGNMHNESTLKIWSKTIRWSVFVVGRRKKVLVPVERNFAIIAMQRSDSGSKNMEFNPKTSGLSEVELA